LLSLSGEMMVYYLESDDRTLLKKLLKRNVCAECGSQLESFFDLQKKLPYLQCKANPKHEGIAREFQEPKELNIPTRREEMEKEHGEEKTTALMRYPTTGVLSKQQAMEVLRLVYPEVPDNQIIRTAIICKDFGLHPLMKEIYIIPFGQGEKRTWSTVLGINATRKMMARFGSFSYVDNTPRVMTEEEQKTIFGEVQTDRIVAITKLKTKGGLEAQGYGHYLLKDTPYGTDKGNTKANMAFIRSERQAFSRLFPDSIPQDVEVIDEAYIGSEVRVVDEKTGEITEASDIEGAETEDKLAEEVRQEMQTSKEKSSESKPEPTPAKEDRRVNNDELLKLGDMIKQTGVTLTQLGKYMKVDKKWEVSKLGDLKKWQFDEIMAAFQRGKDEAPKGKLL